MPRLSLTSRAFLFSAVPICSIVLLLLFAIQAAVHSQIKSELREQLRESDSILNDVQSAYSRRIGMFASKLAEDPGLKAAIGLLSEVRHDPSSLREARDTIALELRDLKTSSGFDLVALTDRDGAVIADILCESCLPDDAALHIPAERALLRIRTKLYQILSTPINAGGDEIGTLVLGSKFDLRAFAQNGQAVLLRDGKVIASTVSGDRNDNLEKRIAAACNGSRIECEIPIGGKTFIGFEAQKGQLGDHYQLFSLKSLDSRVTEFTSHFLKMLIFIATIGLALVITFTFATSRFVSHPLRALVTQLNHSELSGGMSAYLDAGSAVKELTSLAHAYNSVVDSERRTRTQLEVARDAAQIANRLKDEFLTNISHELRTPLNGVLGMTDILLATPLEEEQKECAATARESALDLLALVERILTFSNLQTGAFGLELSAFDPRELVVAALLKVRAKAEQKKLRLEFTDDSHAFPKLTGDPECIAQILDSLFENAVKFTDRGWVRVGLRCVLQDTGIAAITISVEDSGIGIAPEHHELIFERFTQADGSLTRARGGTGLGLTTARALAARMNGHLALESIPGKGSTFQLSLKLPLAHKDASPRESVAATAQVVTC